MAPATQLVISCDLEYSCPRTQAPCVDSHGYLALFVGRSSFVQVAATCVGLLADAGRYVSADFRARLAALDVGAFYCRAGSDVPQARSL